MNIPTVTGRVPTTTYLRKFVEFIEGLEAGEPLDLTSQGIVPKYLKGILVGKRQLYQDFPHKKLAGKDDEIRYIVNEDMLDSGRHFLTRRHINAFNSFVYSQFHAMLLFKIRLDMKKGATEKEVILDYMQILGIEEEEYSMTSIKRQITRLRTSKHMPTLRERKQFFGK